MGLVATPLAMGLAFDGARSVELTAEHDALDTEVSPFGPSPTTGAAFLLGFARAPENGAAAVFPEEIRLHLFRTPAFGGPPVSSDDPVLVPPARLVAEYRTDPQATGWRRLDILEDETVTFLRSCALRTEGPADRVPTVLREGDDPLHWIRTRLARGGYTTGTPPQT